MRVRLRAGTWITATSLSRIGTDDLGVELAAIAQGDGDGVGAIDHMVVGDDVAAPGVHHHPGTDALRPALARLVGD